MPALIIGGVGLLIGSFLNVVVFRVPNGKSVVSPPSACPECASRIRSRDNIPVISWLLLRGRCRDCGAGISPRYPLVELGTAALFAVIALWASSRVALGALGTLGMVAWSIELIAFLYLGAVSVALALIDLDTHTLPNRILLPASIVAAVALPAVAILRGDPGQLFGAALGGISLFALYLAMALAYPGGMGFGDVKLAGVLGIFLGWLGWGAVVVGAFSAFLLGGFFAVVLLISGRASRKSGIPFGPWMLAGAWVGIFAGDAIASGYLRLFDLA